MAFSEKDSVELVLHLHAKRGSFLHLVQEIDQAIVPKVIASAPVDEHGMLELYNSCDAFVSATRGEGWGLPIIEAMACAKPVIVTHYSGHLEFVNASNAYLIDVEKMIDVDDPNYFDPNNDYGQWAEPSAEHLAQLMRHVYENPEEATELGVAARKEVAQNWKWDSAAKTARHCIQELRRFMA